MLILHLSHLCLRDLLVPDQVNASRVLAYSNWNQEVFMGLPEWLANKISETPEYKAKFAMPHEPMAKLDVVESDSLPSDMEKNLNPLAKTILNNLGKNARITYKLGSREEVVTSKFLR
jgi:hypothetical protein